MKAVVLACLEHDHLDLSLDALLRWLPAEDVLVFNNGNRPDRVDAIERVARRWGVATGRTHDLLAGENTLIHIHEALKEIVRMWPGETILKLDEDVLLVSNVERWQVSPRELLIPAVTVNNYTSRFFFRAVDPELAELADAHPWIWHTPHPQTGEDLRGRALGAIYGSSPEALQDLCSTSGDVRRYGAGDWQAQGFMTVDGDHRGISSTAVAFRADDYLELCGAGEGVEEVLLATAVHDGRAEYVVDTRLFCHHVNYHSVRPQVLELGEHVEAWNRRAIVAATAAAFA